MAKKRTTGTLSNDAKAFIQENCAKLPPEDIAQKIGKSVGTVNRYIKKAELTPFDETYEQSIVRDIRSSLHAEGFWAGIEENYSETEKVIFESKWIALIRQFQGDVTETEKLQIHKYLTLFLLRERSVKKQTLFQRTLDSVASKLDEIKRQPPDEQNKLLIDKLANTIQSLTSESKNITNEIRDLSKQETEIERALKGTRDQRIKLVNDATKNFSSVMELLQKPEVVNQIGMHLEIHREAAIKAREKIAKPHQFMNKTVDLPLLDFSTVDNLDLADWDN